MLVQKYFKEIWSKYTAIIWVYQMFHWLKLNFGHMWPQKYTLDCETAALPSDSHFKIVMLVVTLIKHNNLIVTVNA
jgi:hypothetical protein